MPFRDAAFDTVFDFGALHIVAEWKRALDEVRRVLTPGGGYFFEWVTGRARRALYPLGAERFERIAPPEAADLLDALARRGLRTEGRIARPRLLAALTYLVGDVLGVARLTA
jgi:ubiquinone/menaquinone biosynthesis C-methylase UbiE